MDVWMLMRRHARLMGLIPLVLQVLDQNALLWIVDYLAKVHVAMEIRNVKSYHKLIAYRYIQMKILIGRVNLPLVSVAYVQNGEYAAYLIIHAKWSAQTNAMVWVEHICRMVVLV
jgi:hypothetical protein